MRLSLTNAGVIFTMVFAILTAFILNESPAAPILIFIGLPVYAPLFYFAKKSRSLSVYYFFLMIIVSRLITLPLLHYLREDFTESGWTAIKKFDFSFSAYSQLMLTDGFAILLIFIAFLLLRTTIPESNSRPPGIKKLDRLNSLLPAGLSEGQALPAVFLFFLVNYSIFTFASSHKIGVTGIEPDALPFKLSGIIYYYEKFLGPILLFFILKNSKSKLLAFALAPLLVFVGISTLSRSTIAMWAIPVFYTTVRNCRSTPLTLFIALMMVTASMLAGIGRNLMFVAEGSAIGLDISVSMLDILLSAATTLDVSDLALTAASLVSRLGGGQEMVLGAQTAFPDFVYAIRLLFQIFTDFSFGIDYQSLVTLTHDFVPLEGTVAGIAYSGYMLAFLNSNSVVYLLFAIFSAAILKLNDRLRSMVYEVSQNARLSNTLCFTLNFIFFAMFMVSWYWFSVFLVFGYVLVSKRIHMRPYRASLPTDSQHLNR